MSPKAQRVYLDWNATAPLRPEARAAMIAAMDVVGNPSSVHAEGRTARAIVERARGQVATLLGCEVNEVVFSSGATEAAALCIPEFATVCTSAVEHDCVEAWSNAGETGALRIDVDGDGSVLPSINGEAFAESLWDDVVAFQRANGETGVLQNSFGLAEKVWAAQRGTKIVVDAVQALGKEKFDLAGSGADYVLSSAHKIGGPKGVGALGLKLGVELPPKAKGGGQEQGRRAGTENVIGIAGFGAAAEAAQRDLGDGVWEPVTVLRDAFEARVAAEAPDAIIVGMAAKRLPNTSCIAVPGWKGETQVMQMDLAGFAISAGSACSSGKVKSSRVLKAMGYDEITAASAIRVSIGPSTSEAELMSFADVWLAQYAKFKSRAA
ncbi:MAG: cysteine desulfurase [Rhodobacteraceae bacterium]|nr:cysteine desulfurase [Paracoccaceae bacterium]